MSYIEGSRFSEYTPNDHQAPIWIATALTLTYALLFLLVRIAVKFRALGLDDVFLCVAHVSSATHVSHAELVTDASIGAGNIRMGCHLTGT